MILNRMKSDTIFFDWISFGTAFIKNLATRIKNISHRFSLKPNSLIVHYPAGYPYLNNGDKRCAEYD